jgi:hypothetical protein
MSFTLIDIWTYCRFEPPIAALARLVLGLGCWMLPFAILIQVRRIRRVKSRYTRRQSGGVLSLVVVCAMVVSSVAVLWSQFFVLHPRVYWDGQPDPELWAIVVRDHAWWAFVSGLSIALALTFHWLRRRHVAVSV